MKWLLLALVFASIAVFLYIEDANEGESTTPKVSTEYFVPIPKNDPDHDGLPTGVDRYPNVPYEGKE